MTALLRTALTGLLLASVPATAALAYDPASSSSGSYLAGRSAAKLRDNSDIKEFYLGLNEGGARKSYHDTKHYKRRKRWLS